MTVYMQVTMDEYELPLVVCDYAQDLAKKCGISKDSLFSRMSHAKKENRKCCYIKVEFDEEEEE